MVKKAKKEPNFIKWLRRIFTAQSFSIFLTIVFGIVACIGVWYGRKTYQDNQPAQISLEFYYDHEQSINVNEKTLFVIMMNAYYGCAVWGSGAENGFFSNGLPAIENKSGKSINGLQIDITIEYGRLCLDEAKINRDYEIVDRFTMLSEHKGLRLRYKYDIMKANTAAPIPITLMTLADEECCPECMFPVKFHYDITYDGLNEPLSFDVRYAIYFYDESMSISKERFSHFVDLCYKEGWFTEFKKSTLVSIIYGVHYTQIIYPPRKLSDKNYESFKCECWDIESPIKINRID